MFVKLTPGFDFIIILRAALPQFLCAKNTKANCNSRKAAQNTFVQKMSPTFCYQILPQFLCAKKIQSQNEIRDKLCKTQLYKKDALILLLCSIIKNKLYLN